MRSISGLLVLLWLSAPCFSAELLSEKALEETTARGNEADASEVTQDGSSVAVQIQRRGQITQVIGARSQMNLRGGAVTNAAGVNQIANGINVR